MRLSSLRRVSCVCHWLNLCLRTIYFEGSPPSAHYPQGLPKSPVRDVVLTAHRNAITLANSPTIKEVFLKRRAALVEADPGLSLPLPTRGMPTRWGSYELCIQTTCASKDLLEPLYSEFQSFSPMVANDFVQLAQLEQIMSPFSQLSMLLDGGKYVTVSLALGELWLVLYEVFYEKIADDDALMANVKAFKDNLKKKIGRRLMANHSECELSHAGLMLHPFWKAIRIPQTMPARLSTDDIYRLNWFPRQADGFESHLKVRNRPRSNCTCSYRPKKCSSINARVGRRCSSERWIKRRCRV